MAKQNYPPVLHRQQRHYTALKMRITILALLKEDTQHEISLTTANNQKLRVK